MQVPEYLNSSVISNAGSQIQTKSKHVFFQCILKLTTTLSLKSIIMNELKFLYQLPFPQIQEYDLQPGEQIKKPSTNQIQKILNLQRLIKLNEKIVFTFRIVSEPSLLHLFDSNGCTLLHSAALNERNGTFKILLIKRIDYKKTYNEGRTILDIAIKQKNQILIDYIYQIKRKGLKELHSNNQIILNRISQNLKIIYLQVEPLEST
ncbi:unnamed protein product (macronuclear) [Paramecium tetraurelia]|uniref:Uncharacterized protein n=1 Tax=Paramecium tetraurelia TaxID=5888 RepID=A0CBF6_PARTE|nr:uncharacterized protein GSPATT00036906001 [Paramecium tetraurelia]CAK68123.1 unnamed protein product [Paramecium tetraurelia]|eukprot:XP_001435520.1 hypothetical protein (macronuclear) [Paramecium tetraurelia strain d4-2]